MAKVKLKKQVKLYNIIYRAVSEGVNYGYSRAYKYVDDPFEEDIKDATIDGVMNSLDNYIDLGVK